ncbi:MAG: hypothetical protein CM15mP123_14050 [Gammaproteobacteria bacterium]|nr:MAG: hypothetical protein CM15mP123_14050 [Gammaproteobacteria bacterium]
MGESHGSLFLDVSTLLSKALASGPIRIRHSLALTPSKITLAAASAE